jgi:heavy metal translocating P-type ATPase
MRSDIAKKNGKKESKFFLKFNIVLTIALGLALVAGGLNIFSAEIPVMESLALFATAIVVVRTFQALKVRTISIDLLASVALILSIVQKEWMSALFINLMISSARIFFEYVKITSHSAIEELLDLKPKKAMVERGGTVVEIPLEQVKKGDLVVAELGEMIPVDGIVEKGEAEVNQASLTGESASVPKKSGDQALSSTMVVSGELIIRAEKIGKETVFEKIINLVEKAQSNKAQIDTLGDKFSEYYIIGIIAVSVIAYSMTKNLDFVLSIMLVSCADDIAVATPLALSVAITKAAKRGVIIKGGNFLEGLSRAKDIFIDKTGTLTTGKLKVERVVFFEGRGNQEFLGLSCAASLVSHHPVSHAIVNYAREKNISLKEPDDFKEYSGEGIIASCGGKKVISGKLPFFRRLNILMDGRQISQIEAEQEKGFNIVLLGDEKELRGYIVLTDELRPGVKETVKELKRLGIEKIIMLTGDNGKVAEKIAGQVGLDGFHADLLPEDKLKYIQANLNDKYKTAMVGDGVNDAPVLALADIGIAMGAVGSGAAIESADIALMKDDLSQLPRLVNLSKSALRVIVQNFFLWGIFNTIGLVLVSLHIIGPSGAAAWNFVTDFFPILNSLRLIK